MIENIQIKCHVKASELLFYYLELSPLMNFIMHSCSVSNFSIHRWILISWYSPTTCRACLILVTFPVSFITELLSYLVLETPENRTLWNWNSEKTGLLVQSGNGPVFRGFTVLFNHIHVLFLLDVNQTQAGLDVIF